ncbi:hypothetical protein CMI47_10120 [Candidatus Pacearchaeota archaeon]|nr:hypothetical protein [Candidatus Pacearchaeota archaeon]|tara:strand:- start:3444 stop:3809 length:366 start_codon:yes stop_codon:yes gene_type:complete
MISPLKNANGTMNLMTEAMARNIPSIGGQSNIDDPIAHFKFFGGSSWTWYLTELDQETGYAYGKVYSDACPDGEWGDFLLFSDEYPKESLAGIKFPPFGAAVERDKFFKKQPMSLCRNPCA